MGDQLRYFVRLYYRPLDGLSGILDRGSLAFALGLAVAAFLSLQWVSVEPPEAAIEIVSPALDAVTRFVLPDSFAAFAAVSIVFVFAGMALLAGWDHLGSFGVVLQRDFFAVVTCVLTCWAAAYLPIAILSFAVSPPRVVQVAAHLFFLVLAALCFRTVLGTGTVHASAATSVAWVAAVSFVFASSFLGHFLYYLASPIFLLYGYILLQQSNFSISATGLSARQSFKSNLEACTVNPRDADAHYQLGLIYAQRRDFDRAAERFRKAMEIDPEEPDPRFQLGLLARKQGNLDEAEQLLRATASLDDKHASSEVWRELGVLFQLQSRLDESFTALDRYVERRPYDPEGLFHFGQVLKALGRPDEAREALQRAIEAADSMPRYRRRETRRWRSAARKELKSR